MAKNKCMEYQENGLRKGLLGQGEWALMVMSKCVYLLSECLEMGSVMRQHWGTRGK